MKKSTPGFTRGACSVIGKDLLGSLDDVQRSDGVIIILSEQNGLILVGVGGVVAVDGAGGDVTVGINNIHDHVGRLNGCLSKATIARMYLGW